MTTQTDAMMTQFLQAATAVRFVMTKNGDGSLQLEVHDNAGGVVASTAPASDVSALVATLGAA